MDIFYADTFPLPLPDGHRFPLQKYALLRHKLETAGWQPAPRFFISPAATNDQLQRVHIPEYVQQVVEGTLSAAQLRQIGFPWSPQLVERCRRSVGGTVAACWSALAAGVAVHLAGGTHHASQNSGSGFCVFNDVAVAARDLQASGRVQRVLIVDADVHQGDGTAQIFQNDPSVYTFSIHGAKNFPFRKAVGDLDIALPDNTGDAIYLAALRTGLDTALEQSQAQFVIYLAGSDPYEGDRLGRLALTKNGLAQRDQLVLQFCQQHQLPVGICMSGGYAPDVNDSVDIHFQTVQLAWKYGKK